MAVPSSDGLRTESLIVPALHRRQQARAGYLTAADMKAVADEINQPLHILDRRGFDNTVSEIENMWPTTHAITNAIHGRAHLFAPCKNGNRIEVALQAPCCGRIDRL